MQHPSSRDLATVSHPPQPHPGPKATLSPERQQILEQAADALVGAGYAPRTVAAYLFRIRHLVSSFGRPPATIHPRELARYLGHLAGSSGWSRRACLQSHSALRRLFFQIYGRYDLRELLRRPPLPRHKPPRVLTPNEVDRLFRRVRGPRDRALFGLMVGAGLRSGEVVHLRVRDIHFREGRIDVPAWGKCAPRTEALPRTLRPHILEAVQGKFPQTWLFPGSGTGPLTPRTVQKRLAAAARRARLGSVTPTVLRETFKAFTRSASASPVGGPAAQTQLPRESSSRRSWSSSSRREAPSVTSR